MLKKISLIIFFDCILMHVCLAQSGEWTWMKGSSMDGSSGVFGTQGVADSTNTPPALYGAGPFTDKAGNFWMVGGYGIG